MAITIPNTFVAGTKIEVAPMNANFAEAANALDKRGNDTIAGNISVAAGVKIDGVDLSTIPNSSGTFDPLFAQVVIGSADTNGIRLDLESGTLAVREGNDSAYAPLITSVVNLPSTGSINFASSDITITHSTNTLAFAGASTAYTFADGPVIPAVSNATSLGSSSSMWSTVYSAGVTFPSTQSASGDPNTLDDYEEGTYTATLTPTSGSVTLDANYNTLQYTKIGRVVHVSGHIKIASVSTPATDWAINLPFTAATLTDDAGGFGFTVQYYNIGGYAVLAARANNGATGANISGQTPAANHELWVSFSYVV